MQKSERIEIDPVCQMKVEKTDAKFFSEYKGGKYYFCSSDCKKAFDIAPDKYAK